MEIKVILQMPVLFPTGATGGCRTAPAHPSPRAWGSSAGSPRPAALVTVLVSPTDMRISTELENGLSAHPAQLLHLFFYLLPKLQEITTCNASQILPWVHALAGPGAEGLLLRG